MIRRLNFLNNFNSYAEYKFWLKMNEPDIYDLGRKYSQHKYSVRRKKKGKRK